jgi:hypothetical protein
MKKADPNTIALNDEQADGLWEAVRLLKMHPNILIGIHLDGSSWLNVFTKEEFFQALMNSGDPWDHH